MHNILFVNFQITISIFYENKDFLGIKFYLPSNGHTTNGFLPCVSDQTPRKSERTAGATDSTIVLNIVTNVAYFWTASSISLLPLFLDDDIKN